MANAVVFDLFETLITEWGHEKYTKRKMCEDLGIPQDAFAPLWESLHEKQYRGGISFADSIRYVCNVLGVSLNEKTLTRVIERRCATKAACFDCLHPEIIPMLDALRENGYRIGILSNCSEEEVKIARESVLASHVDCMILSHETGYCKPETEIYRIAADALGTDCKDSLFIGDGGSRELYGAAAAFMKPYRAMWYIRQMPMEINPQPEFAMLETPMDVLRMLHHPVQNGTL